MSERLRLVREMWLASKHAASSSTSCVVSVDFGIERAHHAGKAHRALAVIGDDAHVRRERALLAVEGLDRLARARGAHHHVATPLALGELAEVEGVQRLARQHHDVVRHVDDVVDGAHARRRDTAREPVGRGADLDAAHHARRVAAAELRGRDRHLDDVVHVHALVLVLDLRQLDVRDSEIARVAIEDGRGLDGHAHHREAVGAVGGDLAIEHGVRPSRGTPQTARPRARPSAGS